MGVTGQKGLIRIYPADQVGHLILNVTEPEENTRWNQDSFTRLTGLLLSIY